MDSKKKQQQTKKTVKTSAIRPIAKPMPLNQYLMKIYKNPDVAYFTGMNDPNLNMDKLVFPNMSVFKMHRYKVYTNDDLTAAIRILEQFSFVSLLEGTHFRFFILK